MSRNYSDAYDPEITLAELEGWPTRAEAEQDMAEPMTVRPTDCRGCGVCLACALRGRA